MLLDWLKNNFLYENKYRTHSEAVIISCFYNPQNSPYRLKAFKTFYESIKHLNHSIVECVIGETKPQLSDYPKIKQIYTENLLWHKESLLNKIVSELPSKYKYVLWVDADVLFTNKNWVVDSVNQLKLNNIIQPFEYCVHLEQDRLKPSFDIPHVILPNRVNKSVWRSFSANYVTNPELAADEIYNDHGHVGFAWGARREILEQVPLYDKALIGGADHVIAHAAAGHIPHKCITKAFTDNIDEVLDWSRKFYSVANGKIGYVKGDLYHIWHGDTAKRQYLKRIQDFTSETMQITERDENGLYITKKGDSQYIKNYFNDREVPETEVIEDFDDYSDNGDFLTSVAFGYAMNDGLSGGLVGGSIIGGIIGDALNTEEGTFIEDNIAIDYQEEASFSGGESGGGGATSSWDDNNENFS